MSKKSINFTVVYIRRAEQQHLQREQQPALEKEDGLVGSAKRQETPVCSNNNNNNNNNNKKKKHQSVPSRRRRCLRLHLLS
jgi:hypothetical protein